MAVDGRAAGSSPTPRRLLENNAEVTERHRDRGGRAGRAGRLRRGRSAGAADRVEPRDQRAPRDAVGRTAAAGGRGSRAPASTGRSSCRSQDEGVGIAPEELDGIFQPFRGGFARGTGLGLSIVHRIASDYGGEVRVASKQGVGTTVEVVLPLTASTGRHRGHRVAAMSVHVQTVDRAAADAAARILIVDDERSMREMLAILLRREGHEVAVAENGANRARSDQQPPVRRDRVGRPHARRGRPRRAAAGPRGEPLGHRDHDHRLRIARSDQGRRAARRQRLRREAVQHRGPEIPHQKGTRSEAAAAGERAAEARDADGAPVREHHRHERHDAARLRAGRYDRADRQHRARHRRIGNRQGAHRARHTRAVAARGAAVRRRELRRAHRDAARLGALRPRARRVHRRRRATRRGSSRSPTRGRSSSTRSAR